MNLSALTKYCLVAPPLHRVSADVTLNWISSDLGGDFGSTGEIKIWKNTIFQLSSHEWRILSWLSEWADVAPVSGLKLYNLLNFLTNVSNTKGNAIRQWLLPAINFIFNHVWVAGPGAPEAPTLPSWWRWENSSNELAPSPANYWGQQWPGCIL